MDKTERENYQAEVRKLRGELHAVRGGGDGDAPERPKRLTLSQIVEMLLGRASGERSTVTLSRNASGETQIEVKVRTGDEGDVQTVEDAEQKAHEVYARLAAQYPAPQPHANASVSLTRNAKGDTQIEVKGATTSDGAATLDALAVQVGAAYEDARDKYPLLVR